MEDSQPDSPSEPPRKRPTHFLRQLAFAMELPFILVGGVLVGGALGLWIDGRLGTSPLFTFLLGLIGFGAGVREVLRRIPKGEKENGGG